MNELEAAKLQKIMYASYPWVEVDQFRTRVFFRVLEPYTFKECSDIVVDLLREPDRKQPPTTNDIFNRIYEKKRLERQASIEVLPDKTSDERRRDIVNEMHALHPDLFK